jgi:hypothetical protein
MLRQQQEQERAGLRVVHVGGTQIPSLGQLQRNVQHELVMTCRDEMVKQSAKQHAPKNKKDANKCDSRSPAAKAAARTSKRLTNGRRRQGKDKEWQDGAVSANEQRTIAHSVVEHWEGRQENTKKFLGGCLPEVPWHAHHPSLRGREGERCGQNGSKVERTR